MESPPAVPQEALVPDPVLTMVNGIAIADWSAAPAIVSMKLPAGFGLPRNHSSELLSEFRCTSVIRKHYTRTQRNLDVYVYTFPDTRSAFAAYATMRSGSSNVVVRGDASSEDDDTISFLKGTRFVTIITTAEDDELSKRAASQLADQLSTAIDEQWAPPAVLNTLPLLDRMRGTERIFFGPLAARKFISVPYMQVLQLDAAHPGVYADYQFPRPEPDRLKLMLVDYGSDSVAAKVYHDYAIRLEESGHKTKLLSTSAELVRMLDSWMLVGHSRGRVYLITGAKHKISSLILARQLY